MLTRLPAIAALAFRTAIRSRLVLSLMLLLTAVVIGLPLTLQGDGTLVGDVQILLNYTLGLAAMILGVATLWASCSSISREIEQRHIHLISTKPVHGLEIWVGKWLGLLAINAVLLGGTGVATYGLLQLRLRQADVSPDTRQRVEEQILRGQAATPARPDNLDSALEERLRALTAEGLIAAEPDAGLRRNIARQLRAERSVVAPGAGKEWRIDATATPAGTRPVVRIRFAPTNNDDVSGTWTFSNGDGSTYAYTMSGVGERRVSIPLPGNLLTDGGVVTVQFRAATGAEARPVVFDVKEGVTLLIPHGSFEANLVRALLVIFSQLALLAALGLTAGTCFSFPVAAFFASVTVLLALTGHAFTSTDDARMFVPEQHANVVVDAMQAFGERAIAVLERVARPAVAPRPLAALADGVLVLWLGTGLMAIGYSAALAIISTALLRQRELALP